MAHFRDWKLLEEAHLALCGLSALLAIVVWNKEGRSGVAPTKKGGEIHPKGAI